jgi:hypothetical protein
MKRAIGGLGMAAAASPSVILGAALARARHRGSTGAACGSGSGLGASAAANSGGGGGAGEDEVFSRFYQEFPLAGEAIAHRIGGLGFAPSTPALHHCLLGACVPGGRGLGGKGLVSAFIRARRPPLIPV